MPHINDLIDFTVEVFIVHKNKVLLRKHDKYGIWLGIGGHVEPHEDPNQAIIREAKEEVGLDIELDRALFPETFKTINYQELVPPYFLNRHNINSTHEHVTMTYFATVKNPKIKEGGKEKSGEIKWFNIDELKKIGLSPGIKFYAEKALRTLSK